MNTLLNLGLQTLMPVKYRMITNILPAYAARGARILIVQGGAPPLHRRLKILPKNIPALYWFLQDCIPGIKHNGYGIQTTIISITGFKI